MQKKDTKFCVYCSNIDIQNRKVIENKLAFVFPTNIPIVPGHLLIAPKRITKNMQNN